MKRIAVLLLALSLLPVSLAFAKRGAPAVVKPVRAGDVEFRAPHNQMGCVEAWDVQRDQLVWRRQIYAVRYSLELERDVQDVFVKSLVLKDDNLLVTNERTSEYQLDLDSLEVKVLQGSLVERRK